MIDYKTYEEQISILKERCLLINDENSAIEFLKANNYYNVINAYKDIFIKKGVTPEQYVNGATFDELKAIHSFDKDLRILLSNNLIIIERLLKSIISHEFSKNHRNHDLDYLNIDNFDTTITTKETKLIAASQLMNGLNKELSDAIEHSDPMICHYKNTYNRVPIWVFINKISFGTVCKFFSLLQSNDKYAIAKSISLASGQQATPSVISSAMKILVLLRNKTAHDQRIYDFSSRPLTVSKNNPFIKRYSINNCQTLFGAFACMSLFLNSKQFRTFCSEVKKLVNDLFLKIHSIPTQIILLKMGIPQKFLLEK